MNYIGYNKNIAVVGTHDSQRLRMFVINYILQAIERRESVIVSDAKGEVYDTTAKLAQNHGYKTKILNLVDLEHSDGWNILNEVKNSPVKISQFTDIILDNTEKDNREFWELMERLLLRAILLLKSARLADTSTMKDVYEFTTLTDEEMKVEFDTLESKFPFHPAVISFKKFWQAGKIRGHIIHGLSNRLQLFQDLQLSKVLNTNNIDLTEPGKTPCIYYLRFSEQHTTYRAIALLFISFLYIKLKAYAESLKKHILTVEVTMLLNDFCTLGKIPDLYRKLTVCKSKGINTVIPFQVQDIPQIKSHYKDTWNSIINCCDILFGDCNII